MMKIILKSTALLLTLFIQVSSTQAQTAKASYVPGQLIVKFKAGKTAKTNHLITQLNAKRIENLANKDVQIWQLENKQASTDMEALAETYANHPDIEFIEPNYLYTTSDVQVIPNDTGFNQQWALHNTGELEGSVEDADIDAPEAWAIQSESPSIVVGIIDTGVDWRHPDLIDNIWQNLAEDIDSDGVVIEYDTLLGRWAFDPGDINGEDDDGNGYADDFIGWNFVDNNNQPFDYEAAEDGYYVQSHGTHVAGIIGASGNNEIGVSGVTPQVQLAILKFLSDDPLPEGTAANAAAAIDYAVRMNFQISNNSWGGSNYSSAIAASINKAAANNHLFVTAAGNGGEDNIGDNIDQFPAFYPAHYGYNYTTYDYWYPDFVITPHEGYNNIITVANSTQSDALSSSSNFGINAVHIAAPGTDIYNCLPFGYGWLSGTSMATPHVTGACALLWERGRELFDTVHYDILKDILINQADTLAALKAKTAGNGRLNMHQALLAMEKTAQSNLYKTCRSRDSVIVRNLYDSLNVRNGNSNPPDLSQPIDKWYGVTLNSMGCVSRLNLNSNSGYIWTHPQYTGVPIKAQLPKQVGNLSELTELKIWNTIWNLPNNNTTTFDEEIYSTLPVEMGNLQKLKKLSISGQLLAGDIPSEISQLKKLNKLDLSDNHLAGYIPTELLDLPKLQTLNLSSNKLEGNIPQDINRLGSLMNLFLSQNNLSGAIPNSIVHLNNLQFLDLAHNHLSGTIPPDIGYINALYFIWLNNNQLTGSIPPEFYYLNIAFQNGINISHNQLSGCYDPAIAYISESSEEQWNAKSDYYNGQISEGNNFDASWSDFIETEAGSCWASEVSRVWPGDLNNDGKVNQKDIVFYGFATGNSGPNREVSDTSWIGHLCPDWSNQILGINGKHQDADGNGLVDTIDYGFIIQNWGKINPNHYNGTGDLRYVSNGIELVLEKVESEPDGTYDLFLKRVGNTNAPVYGVAGTIEFNLPISPESTIKFDESCLASDGTYADFKFNFENTLLEFGLTQTDNVNIVCEDALARVFIVSVDIEGEGGDPFLSFKVNALTSEANNQTGGAINEAIGASMSQTLQAPSDDNFNIRVESSPQLCRRGGKATALVSGGKRPYQYQWSTGKTTNKIVNLLASEYTLIVTDDNGISDTLTVEVDDQQIPEYDEEGKLIFCEMITETECANSIDFDWNLIHEADNIVEQGFYAAYKTINTSGKILENKEVDFQAGEKVSLQPGFTMEPNTRLSVKIQNCNEE